MLAFVIGAALFLDACSTAPMNKPLNQATLNNGPGDISIGGYRSKALPDGDTSDQLLVLLASSGGGKRSAAFSYGVLRGLRDFEIPVNGRERRLLDELDSYAAVSGGSFPAAYYGLYRDRLFTDFERDFLKTDIGAYIWGIYLLPWRWEWMVNSTYGTNDEMVSPTVARMPASSSWSRPGIPGARTTLMAVKPSATRTATSSTTAAPPAQP
jgi:NTE family protein